MSTKNSFIAGKDFYVFTELELTGGEEGVFIKLFKPEDVKLMTSNGQVSELEVCISKETWKELQEKIKLYNEKDI